MGSKDLCMDITVTRQPATQVSADVVVVGCYEGQPLSGAAAHLDGAMGGALGRLVAAKEITGKHAEVSAVLAPSGVKAGQIVVVGLGKREAFDCGKAFRAAGAAAKYAAGKERQLVAFFLEDGGWSPEMVEGGVVGAIVGCQGQDLYRAEKKLYPFARALWGGDQTAPAESGRVLGECVNDARRLVNRPSSEIYPESLAAEAEQVATRHGLEVEIWDEKRLAAERCGSLLAVARGSARPPRMVILKYQGTAAKQPPLALVGKGVTFDSGGLSLKPADSMKTMKGDMAGAATVLAALQAIAQLKLPVNVLGLAGLVENMVSGSAYKVGDVLTARSGKTIEVLNTDAEGRLVLADVLDVAVERGAERILDVATLTGACVVALGTDVAGLMGNDQEWCDQVAAAANACGEPAWPLPMFPEYAEQIKSQVADIKNVGEGRWGAAITAAKFLEEFVQGKPWVHLDIAGPSFLETAKPWLDAGATGAFVRTLVEVARGWRAETGERRATAAGR